jgi:hypothetical protein
VTRTALLRSLAALPASLWASPPCDEFARESMRHLSPLLGPPLVQLGPSQSYLWGDLPLLMPRGICTGKERMSSSAAAQRAAIPYDVSLVVAMAVERAIAQSRAA